MKKEGGLEILSMKYSTNHKKVFGEAFFKKLQETVHFLRKGGTQKLLLFSINQLFPTTSY
ncbi:hypothetical protein [Komagataeibacter kakiaceti]